MNILAIDTSTQVMGVALLKDEEIIAEITTNISKNHSVRLMPAIEHLMKEVAMKPEDINLIVTSIGPGSYTGVRIGLSTAKTMAWALQIPIVGVSSLEMLAYQGRFFQGYICPFIDARRGMVFTGVYQWIKDRLHLIYEEKNIPMNDVLNKLKADDNQILFLSPDIHLHEENIRNSFGDRAIIPEKTYHLPRPGLLGLAGLNKKETPTHALTPNYLRLAEAEAKWLKKQKEN